MPCRCSRKAVDAIWILPISHSLQQHAQITIDSCLKQDSLVLTGCLLVLYNKLEMQRLSQSCPRGVVQHNFAVAHQLLAKSGYANLVSDLFLDEVHESYTDGVSDMLLLAQLVSTGLLVHPVRFGFAIFILRSHTLRLKAPRAPAKMWHSWNFGW